MGQSGLSCFSFEQAPNHDPQTIRKNAPQTPENREYESVRSEFAG